MKKRILVIMLAIAMLMSSAVISFAAEHQLVYNVAFDSEKNEVTVELLLENPVGLEAADLNLAFDEDMFEYVDFVQAEAEGDVIVMAGKSAMESGLATCSVIFMEACSESDLDADGALRLVTFVFKPRAEAYDLDDFCFWASSYSADNTDIAENINVVGKQDLMEDRTAVVEVVAPTAQNIPQDDASTTGSASASTGSGWLVYVIAGVLAVGAIAGVAVIVVRKNRNEEIAAAESSENEKTEN